MIIIQAQAAIWDYFNFDHWIVKELLNYKEFLFHLTFIQ